MRLVQFQKKAGVSLVTVLLFMLVATIAATATYKWLTSEGHSSASRMMKREAYQSSIAGIENARAWMTFHANETGALIKQYIYDDNGKPKATKSPVNMDQQIRSFAQGNSQNHHVWLVGVNTESSTYKVKILSEGVSRNGQARHTEVAIFNVDGLYQVKKPKKVEEIVKTPLPYDYNYFGGSTKTAGDFVVDAMLVNGNLSDGNPAYVKTNMVVTGNYKLSGNGMAVGGNACIGGWANFDNGVAGNNFYVVGNVSGLNTSKAVSVNGHKYGQGIQGSFYAESDILESNGNHEFEGNLTLNGTWHIKFNGYNARVDSNFCTGPNARLVFDEHSKVFQTKGNVWIEGKDLFFWDTDKHDGEDWKKIVLGGSGKTIYSPYVYSESYYKTTFQPNTAANVIEQGEVRGCGAEHDCDHRWEIHYVAKYKYFKEYPGVADPERFVLRGDIPAVTYKAYDNQYWIEHHGDEHTFHAYFINDDTDPFYDNSNIWKELNWNGTKASASTYCKRKKEGKGFLYEGVGFGRRLNSDNARPECHFTNWFKSNASTDVENELPPTKPFECGQTVKSDCNDIWSEHTGCDGSSFYVPDMLVTAYNKFNQNKYTMHDCAKNIYEWSHVGDPDETNPGNKHPAFFGKKVIDLMNACYDTTAAENLYNGYLVVRIQGGNIPNASGETLKGRYIIIFTDEVERHDFPKNNEQDPRNPGKDSYAFVYFEQGAGELLMGDVSTHKYFLYTTKDINRIQKDWTGSVYAAVGTPGGSGDNCAKVPDMIGVKNIDSDADFLADLNTAGILCPSTVSEAACGGAGGGVGSSSSAGGTSSASTSGYEVGGMDPYYISNAPQLGVTLESQYESTEDVPTINDENKSLAPSFIVLPRVIYLNKDPYGKLSDYFNVIPLNGANVTKATANVSCSPSLNVNSNMVSDGSVLSEGIYECNAAPSGLKKVNFWVWVQGSQHGTPTISFIDEAVNLSPGENHEVKIDLPPHATEITVRVACPDAPTGWPAWTIGTGGSQSGSICTFTFPADASGHTQPTLFTVHAPAEAANGSILFVLQTPDAGAGYKLGSPWMSSLIMSSTATLTNTENVLLAEINTFCATHSGCPTSGMRSAWPDCPYKTTKEWVVPDWSGAFPTSPENKNKEWNVVTSATGTLTLKEKTGSGCIVIIPETNNSQPAPIEAGESYSLRAIAKAKSNKITLKFVGDVDGLHPFAKVTAGTRDTICNYTDDAENHSCVVSVFDGENVKIEIDKDDTQNGGFNYWKCDNNGGNTCPSTNPITSGKFSEEGFTVKDDNAIVEAHFGEHDKHCFFDEFRRGSITCGTETEYCIDFCSGTCGSATETGNFSKSKWNLIAGSINNIETSSYPGYVVAAKNAPNTGVRVMSTVQAGIRGTLKALFQLPHATSSYNETSSKIKNSGFLLRANAAGNEFLMLNVYENSSGYLEAQICLDGGTGNNCSVAQLKDKNQARASVSPSSMVMLFATLEGENTLKLKAFTGGYYNTETLSEKAYMAEFNNLSNLGNNHANMTYQYVGFSLAHRDFKIYGIGWESEDYDSECFDTPPVVKCSFAAVATDGIIETGKTLEPWVGHSGWFDSQNCSKEYFYYNGDDARSCYALNNDAGVSCGSSGFYFEQSGAGAHGYVENSNDISKDMKTAKASLSCSPSSKETEAWAATVERAHCGPFWTGTFTECKQDIGDLLEGVPLTVSVSMTPEQKTFAAKNLRGVENLTFTLSNEYAYDVDLEVWLESNSDSWGGTNIESRHVRISGNATTIVKTFDVVTDFGDNATGFDPENIVAVMFKNNGDNAVTVSRIEAPCKNAVKFSGCSVARNGETGWKVTVNISDNADKLSKITAKATVNGENYTLSKSEFDYESSLVLDIPDANIFSNAGKSYAFSVQVYSETNEYTSEFKDCKDTITIGAITCGEASLTHAKLTSSGEIEYGNGNPQYSFTLSECPSKGCAYEVWLNGSKISECTNEQAAGAGCSINPHVTGPEQLPISETSYKYEVKNPTGSSTNITSLSSCEKTFKVVDKTPEEVTCSFTSKTVNATATALGGSLQIIDGVSVSCDGGSCTYTVKDENDHSVGTGDYTDSYGFSFTGDTEAGTHKYKVWVQRGSETAKECTGEYTVNYPLNLDCDSWTDPGASVPIANTDPVNPRKTKAGSGSTYTGCGNSKCKYNVTKGSTSVYSSGEIDNYDGSSATNSFTDAAGADKVTYTLTVSHDGATPKTCTFDVTYASGSSGDVFACTYSSKVQGGIDNQNLSASNVPHTEYDLYIDDKKEVSAVWDNNGNAPTFNFKTPTKLGSHTYKVTKKGETTRQCQGSFEVVNPLLCEIKDEVVLNTQNTFKVSVMEYKENNTQVFTCSNCTYTNVDCGSGGCGGIGVGDKTFTLSDYMPKELKVTCQCNPGNKNPVCSKIAAVKAAPDIDCDALKLAAASGGAGTGLVISPTVIGCAGNCSYTIVGGSTNINHSTADWTSGTAMTSLESESASSTPVSYTLTVTNDVYPYTDNCTFSTTYSSVIPVNAKGKTYDINFEPGKTYSVTINTGGVWRCTVPSNTSYSRTIGEFDGSEMTIDTWQTQSNTVASPGAGNTVTFSISASAPTGLKCDTDYY